MKRTKSQIPRATASVIYNGDVELEKFESVVATSPAGAALYMGDDTVEEDSLDALSRCGASVEAEMAMLGTKSPVPISSSTGGVCVRHPGTSRQTAANRHASKKHRVYDPLYTKDAGMIANGNEIGEIGDQVELDEISSFLRKAAVAIDNIVFILALTSSIFIPFFMFNVLPPSN